MIRQYVGGTAQVAVWPGDSANVLVSGNKIELTSVSGDTGLNIAAEIAGLELVYVHGQ